MNRDTSQLPLHGLVALDLSQFLSGPYASLRLLDLGARVIKIERPDGGDLCRRLYLSDTEIGGDSTIFHAINRGKESLALNLKNSADVSALKKLLAQVDIVIQNFRPGVIERLGLDYESTQQINPRLVYCSISGYGDKGPWASLPGQDLLAQARSGVMWLNGDETEGPVPFGLAIADMLTGATAAQGILAGLVKRSVSGKGMHVETSLLENLIDFQFEVLTTHLNDGRRLPKRSSFRSAHAYLSAPYGVYQTLDGYLAIAMTPVSKLADLLHITALAQYANEPATWFSMRDEIKSIFAEKFATGTTASWMAILKPADIWCAEVLQWPELLAHEAFTGLDMLQVVSRPDSTRITTTSVPLRIDGQRSHVYSCAPKIGEHSEDLRQEFKL